MPSAASQLLLYADSILRGSSAFSSVAPYTSRRSNSELVASLRSLLESLPTWGALDARNKSNDCEWDELSRTLSIPALTSIGHSTGDDKRSDLDVTAKFFYVAPEPVPSTSKQPLSMPASWTGEALDALVRATGIDDVDTFILSFPGVVYPEDCAEDVNGCSDCDDENARGVSGVNGSTPSEHLLRAIASTYEQVSTDRRIHSLGLADLAYEPLRAILGQISPSTPQPRVDQINLRDCCTVSQDLVEFATERDIELLTHADCSDLLPPKTFGSLLSDARSRLPPTLDPQRLSVRWVLKYTVVHKSRNVVKEKGYVVKASAHS